MLINSQNQVTTTQIIAQLQETTQQLTTLIGQLMELIHNMKPGTSGGGMQYSPATQAAVGAHQCQCPCHMVNQQPVQQNTSQAPTKVTTNGFGNVSNLQAPTKTTTAGGAALSASDAEVAKKVDKAFEGTPLAGMGNLVVSEARAKRIPIDLIMSMLWKESSFVSPANNLTIANKNPGNLRWADWEKEFGGKPNGPGNFTTFPSYEHGMKAYIHLLSTVYREQVDNRDWDSLIMKYAPPSENDTGLYIRQMYEYTKNWQEKLGVTANWVNEG